MHTLESEMSPEELALLASTLRAAPSDGSYLEVGTSAGGTLCRMLAALSPAQRSRFVVVDTFEYFQDQSEIFRRNLIERGFEPDELKIRAMPSAAALLEARRTGETFAFMLIDASHKLRYVMEDLGWLGLLSAGGMAALHNYAELWPGVQIAADRFLRRNPHYAVAGRAGSLLVLRKQSVSVRPEVGLNDLVFARTRSVLMQWQQSWRKRRARLSGAR